MRWRIDRPRTHARICWDPSWSPPVLSGSTRTIVPSLTCKRSGHRDPQLMMHADQVVRSTLSPTATSAAFAASTPGRIPKCALVVTRAAAPPAAPDHLRNDRRGMSALEGLCVSGSVMLHPLGAYQLA